MSQIIVYPGDKLEIGLFEGQNELARASFDYPECSCEIGSIVESVKSTFGFEGADIGLAAYGMSESTCSQILKLSPDRVEKICQNEFGEDPTNLSSIILASLGAKSMFQAYPLTYGKLPPFAVLSGIPQIQRRVVAHLFDHIYALKAYCASSGNELEKIKAVTVYLSKGEVSAAGHVFGEIVDVTDSYDGEGPMTPTRSGFFHQRCVYRMALSGKLTKDQLLEKVRTKGGLMALVGTSDLKEVRRRISEGDQKAKTAFDALVYQIAKNIGKLSISVKDKPGVVILTGPLSTDKELVSQISEYIAYIAPISTQNIDQLGILNKFSMEMARD